MAIHAPHVVIVGGAYAGLSALNNLISLSAGQVAQEPARGPPRGPPAGAQAPPGGPPMEDPATKITRALHSKPRYTLIDERDGFYHTVGAPLGQISPSFANEFWIKFDDIVRARSVDADVQFLHGSVADLNLESKTLQYIAPSSNETSLVSYDFLIVATGMRRGPPVVPQALTKEPCLEDVEQLEKELSQYSRIVVVGGGAVGIEMSAELKSHFPESHITLIHSRDTLLSAEPLPDEFKAKALEIVKEGGVEVILGQRVVSENKSDAGIELELSGGQMISCDKMIHTATQRGASSEFVSKDIVDDKGCIQARETMQFPSSLPNADSHYVAGDVVSREGIKRSGPAQQMGKIAAVNIVLTLLAIEDGKLDSLESNLARFPPSKPTMSLAIGDQAVTMRAGVRFGRDVKQRAFGRGLGIEGTRSKLKITPQHLQVVGNGHDTSSANAANI